MSGKVSNLSDILPPELQEATAQPLDDHMEEALVFRACRELQGSNGTYKRISVSLPESEDIFILATGASQPMAVLDWAEKNRQFPFLGQFVHAGRAIILKGID
jgi:hypothetical protein